MSLYATLVDLQTAHYTETSGNAYTVGTSTANTINIWSADNTAWVNIGALQGPAGATAPKLYPQPWVFQLHMPYKKQHRNACAVLMFTFDGENCFLKRAYVGDSHLFFCRMNDLFSFFLQQAG